jgi:hypothetical protein
MYKGMTKTVASLTPALIPKYLLGKISLDIRSRNKWLAKKRWRAVRHRVKLSVREQSARTVHVSEPLKTAARYNLTRLIASIHCSRNGTGSQTAVEAKWQIAGKNNPGWTEVFRGGNNLAQFDTSP